MDKSRDGYRNDRNVPDKPDKPKQSENPRNNEENQNKEPPQQESGTKPSEPISLLVLTRGGMGFRGGPYFEPRFNGELLIGDAMDKGIWEVYLFGGFSHLTANPSHEVYKSIKHDSFTLNAGIEGRFYPLPKQTFMSPYLMGRIGGMILFWAFQNPLKAGSETISSDSLGGLLLGAGLGLDIIHNKGFKLGVIVIPEVLLFGEETSQGFTNDYFKSQGVIRWAVEGGVRF